MDTVLQNGNKDIDVKDMTKDQLIYFFKKCVRLTKTTNIRRHNLRIMFKSALSHLRHKIPLREYRNYELWYKRLMAK